MQVYAIKLFNFLRFGEKNNSIVFDLSDEQKISLENKSITMDELFNEVIKDPLKHIKEAKERGIERYVGILGRSNGSYDESNGCGKSSVLEGICFAHYDRVVRKLANTDKSGEAGLDVIPKINGKYPEHIKESYVEEIFEENGKVYRIKRGRTFAKSLKSNSPYLEFECISETGRDSEAGHRKGDTNKNIDEINVMDYDLFTSSQMFAQNDSGKFLIGTDKTKKEMIIKMLKLEAIVKECMDEVRKRKNSQDKALQVIRSNIDVLEKTFLKSCVRWFSSEEQQKYGNTFNSEIIDVVTKKMDETITTKQKEVEKLSDEVVKVDKQIAELEKSNEITILKNIQEEGVKLKAEKLEKEKQVESQTKEWDKNIVDNNVLIEKKKTQKATLNTKVDTFKSSKEEIKDFIEKFDMQKCNEYLAKVERAKTAKPECEKEIEKITTSKETLIKEIHLIISSIRAKNEEVTEMESQLKKHDGDKFVCRSCKSEVARNHVTAEITKLKGEIETETINAESKDKTLEEVKKSLSEYKDRLNKINECISNEPKVHVKIKDFNDKKIKLKELEESISDYIVQITNADSDIDLMESKNKEYNEKKNTIKKNFEGDIESINKKLKDLRDKYDKAKEEAIAIQNKIKEQNLHKTNIVKWKSDLDKEIGSIGNEKLSLNQQHNEINSNSLSIPLEAKKLERIMLIEDVFGLDGIQTRVIKKYLPLLNVYVKEYMDALTDGDINVSLDINGKSEVVFDISGNAASSFIMLSGGEKMLVHLAVDIGLALLSFSRMAKKPELICLDEVFGALDNSHTEAVFKVLNKLSNSFNRIILISHKSEIQKIIKNNIVIEKTMGINGLSEIHYLGELKEKG